MGEVDYFLFFFLWRIIDVRYWIAIVLMLVNVF